MSAPKLTEAQVRARLQSIAALAVSLQDVDPASERFADTWADLVADVEAIDAHAGRAALEAHEKEGAK